MPQFDVRKLMHHISLLPSRSVGRIDDDHEDALVLDRHRRPAFAVCYEQLMQRCLRKPKRFRLGDLYVEVLRILKGIKTSNGLKAERPTGCNGMSFRPRFETMSQGS